MRISTIVQGDFSRKTQSMRKKIKLAILGSHATVDMLSKRNGPLVSDVYEVCYLRESTAFVSLIAEDLEALIISRPDYIVFDLFADAYHGLEEGMESEESQHTRRSYGVSEGTTNSRASVYYQSSEDIIHFRRSFDQFYQEVKKKLPNTKVIMHRIKMVEEFLESSMHDEMSYQRINDVNISFFMLEEIVSKYSVKTIDVFSNRKGLGEVIDRNRNIQSYERKYYDSFINQFNYICLIDML